ncbi:hypothetical protein AMTR_s00118p00111160 [Amborella trichopoda]|uniref:Aminotransferase-like plant mobile domain-containing protein n=1 Tax=Amborella trichopoda TaxID=13333 RepID=W1NSP4_AMBTC|nr:hypothetical protein AMTR_s00118p00111160 [Amborella trichopoda]
MAGGRVHHILISAASRPSQIGKVPMEEDRDPEGVGCDILKLDDVDIDAVPPPVLLSDEEWREQERERIREAHEWAMIKDDPELFRQEVDLTINNGPLSDDERCSLWAFLAYLFGEFLFPDRSKGRAHLSVVWVTRRLDYLERVAWGQAIVGWLHHHLCSVAKVAHSLGVVQFFSRFGHGNISIPHPLSGRLA